MPLYLTEYSAGSEAECGARAIGGDGVSMGSLVVAILGQDISGAPCGNREVFGSPSLEFPVDPTLTQQTAEPIPCHLGIKIPQSEQHRNLTGLPFGNYQYILNPQRHNMSNYVL